MRSNKVPVQVYRPGEPPQSEQVHVPLERPLRLLVNGQITAIIMRQPGDDIELAVGYCLTSGLAEGFQEIQAVRHCDRDSDSIEVLLAGQVPEQSRHPDTDCLGGAEAVEGPLPVPLKPTTQPVWEVATLLSTPGQLRDHQQQRRVSGGTHAAGMFDRNGALVAMREDIGRHNAADKLVGYCALQGLPTADMMLLVTGRASSLMVIKTARARIPVLATMSNTTSLGLELAEQLGLTLVTYLRGRDLRVCTHPGRIAHGQLA